MRKYTAHSPSLQELAPLPGRPLSPTPVDATAVYAHDPHDMEIDTTPTHPPGRSHASDSRLRTPLPSGPRPEKLALAPFPGIDNLRLDLQSLASRILANPHRTRYASVDALFLYWQGDEDPSLVPAVNGLAGVLDKQYNYTCDIQHIPLSSDECKSSWRWLARTLNDFVENHDRRDVLKIVYYNGHSYLDADREMVLAR